MVVTIGVLALQGGFAEHVTMLDKAAAALNSNNDPAKDVTTVTVRTPPELAGCDALVIPGGESTTMALIAERSGLMEPLREFVRVHKKPTWGTCAGLIFLSKEATGAKCGGQELVGGLDVRVHRNHFGTQKHSFVADIHMPALGSTDSETGAPFPCVFIRAPVVEALLPPSKMVSGPAVHEGPNVEVLAALENGDIVAVRQGNVLGTSFHAELTDDIRLHKWWLENAMKLAG